jgi:hypothetical protein
MDSKPDSIQPENPPTENSLVLEKDSRTTAVYHTVCHSRQGRSGAARGLHPQEPTKCASAPNNALPLIEAVL